MSQTSTQLIDNVKVKVTAQDVLRLIRPGEVVTVDQVIRRLDGFSDRPADPGNTRCKIRTLVKRGRLEASEVISRTGRIQYRLRRPA